MAKKTKDYIKLGLFVILSLALFTIAVYYIGNRQNLFGENFRISSVFQNVNGLQKGNSVRYAGINVGIVNDLIIASTEINTDQDRQALAAALKEVLA